MHILNRLLLVITLTCAILSCSSEKLNQLPSDSSNSHTSSRNVRLDLVIGDSMIYLAAHSSIDTTWIGSDVWFRYTKDSIQYAHEMHRASKTPSSYLEFNPVTMEMKISHGTGRLYMEYEQTRKNEEKFQKLYTLVDSANVSIGTKSFDIHCYKHTDSKKRERDDYLWVSKNYGWLYEYYNWTENEYILREHSDLNKTLLHTLIEEIKKLKFRHLQSETHNNS